MNTFSQLYILLHNRYYYILHVPRPSEKALSCQEGAFPPCSTLGKEREREAPLLLYSPFSACVAGMEPSSPPPLSALCCLLTLIFTTKALFLLWPRRTVVESPVQQVLRSNACTLLSIQPWEREREREREGVVCVYIVHLQG